MAEKSTILVHRNVRTTAVITLISAVVWTSLSVYYTLNKSVDLAIPPEVLAPLDPTYDEQTLQALSQKRQMSDESLPSDFAPITINEVVPVTTPQPSTPSTEIPTDDTTTSDDVPVPSPQFNPAL